MTVWSSRTSPVRTSTTEPPWMASTREPASRGSARTSRIAERIIAFRNAKSGKPRLVDRDLTRDPDSVVMASQARYSRLEDLTRGAAMSTDAHESPDSLSPTSESVVHDAHPSRMPQHEK